jgi:hypothetical protein
MKNYIPKPAEGRKFALYLIEEGNPLAVGWGNYYHLRFKMAVIHLGTMKDCEDECPFGGVRYGDFTTESMRVDDWLRHFEVYSQGNGSDTPRRLYAWQTCYDSPCKPDCEDMRVGAAIIGEVEKRMQREEKTYGICQSYGQYVARVARALGCAHILIPPPKGNGYGNRGRQWANGYTYQVYDVGEAVRVIDNRVDDWVHAVDEKDLATV